MQFDPKDIFPARVVGGIYVALNKVNVDGKVNVKVIGVFDNFYDAELTGGEVQGPFFVKRKQPQPRGLPIIFPKNIEDF